MSKINISLSMPYLLEGTYTPPWALTLEDNLEYLQQLLSKGPKKIAAYRSAGSSTTYPLWFVQHKGLDVYYVESDGCIQYCVEVEQYSTHGLVEVNTLSQTSVWRNKDFIGLPNIAEWVFTKILLPRNKNILSDEMQSKDGRNFWIKRVEASLKRKFVYALWLHGKTDLEVLQVVRLNSVEDMREYYTEGTDLSEKYWRFLITNKELSI